MISLVFADLIKYRILVSIPKPLFVHLSICENTTASACGLKAGLFGRRQRKSYSSGANNLMILSMMWEYHGRALHSSMVSSWH